MKISSDKGGEGKENMPTDLQYKDDLRKQRDNWNYVIRQLECCPDMNNDISIKNAYERAK